MLAFIEHVCCHHPAHHPHFISNQFDFKCQMEQHQVWKWNQLKKLHIFFLSLSHKCRLALQLGGNINKHQPKKTIFVHANQLNSMIGIRLSRNTTKCSVKKASCMSITRIKTPHTINSTFFYKVHTKNVFPNWESDQTNMEKNNNIELNMQWLVGKGWEWECSGVCLIVAIDSVRWPEILRSIDSNSVWLNDGAECW